MTWPAPDSSSNIATTNTDASTDSPASARTDVLSLINEVNSLKALVNSIINYGDPKVIPPGRLIKTTIYSGAALGSTLTGTFTPQAATTFLIVEVQGGGGPGCRVTPAGSASFHCMGGGGYSGAYCKALITSGFSSVAYSVGGGGSAGAGVASSFGSLVVCAGGSSFTQSASNTLPVISSGAAPSSGITLSGATALDLVESRVGGVGVAHASNIGYTGAGASSRMGAGGPSVALYGSTGIGNGNAASGFGAGGSGSYVLGNSTTPFILGGAGSGGCIVVYEYS